ncbi:MAG: hypothetical protein ACXWVP_09545 [Burkholderiales bacterium]
MQEKRRVIDGRAQLVRRNCAACRERTKGALLRHLDQYAAEIENNRFTLHSMRSTPANSLRFSRAARSYQPREARDTLADTASQTRRAHPHARREIRTMKANDRAAPNEVRDSIFDPCMPSRKTVGAACRCTPRAMMRTDWRRSVPYKQTGVRDER